MKILQKRIEDFKIRQFYPHRFWLGFFKGVFLRVCVLDYHSFASYNFLRVCVCHWARATYNCR
jgi:hypothetical protein